MNPDYHDRFRQYANARLLAILRQADQYPPEARAAAEQLLQTRTITPADQEAAEILVQQASTPSRSRMHPLLRLLQPFLKPGSAFQPQQWLGILLVCIALQYTWTLYTSVKALLDWWETDGESFNLNLAILFFNLAYIPLLFYWLLKHKKTGWILLTGETVLSGTGALLQLLQLLITGDDGEFGSQLLLQCGIRMVFAAFLWQRRITAIFSVPDQVRKITVLTAAGLAVLLFALFRLL